MADSTLRLTYTQMRIRIAEYLGMASISGGAATLPTDPHDLDLVGRYVNDGYRRFLTDEEQWNFLKVPLRIRLYAQASGAISSVTGTTFVVSSIAGTYANDFFNGYEFNITDSAGDLNTLVITDFVGSSGTFTVAAMPSSVANADTAQWAGPDNVAGQAWRYYLPDDFFGQWTAPLTYETPNTANVSIKETSAQELREMRARNEITGNPSFVAFRAINTTAATTNRRWEAIFTPTPTTATWVSGEYRRFPAALSSASDVSVAGFAHDKTVLEAALAEAERQRNDKIDIHEAAYQTHLANSMRIDGKATPARNRPYGDGSDRQAPDRPTNHASAYSVSGRVV